MDIDRQAECPPSRVKYFTDPFTKYCSAALVLLLSVIACKQSGPTGRVQPATDVEYFLMLFGSAQGATFLSLSGVLSAAAIELGGKLHSIQAVGMGTCYVAVFEVQKGNACQSAGQLDRVKR